MLEQILQHLRNWFLVPDGIHEGTYTIQGGAIDLPFLQKDQYFRICGSVFNDGLHCYPCTDLKAETFTGTVWALAVPNAVVELSKEVESWQEKNGEAVAGPYQSESFGGYTYTKATDAKSGGAITWEAAFRKRLNQWRKI